MLRTIYCLLLFLFIAASGCDMFTDYGPSYFKIQVDSIIAPNSLNSSDTLVIQFRGTVGTNACMHFWDIENTLGNNKLDVTLWGYEENIYRNQSCVPETVMLEDVIYRTANLSHGTFTITVHQKDGSTLVKTVQVN
jgi:hypothetical protein